MLTRLFKVWFGDFEREELKKYLFLGLIFSLIIGVYWTLRPLKDSIFANMIVGFGKAGSRDIYLAWAKVFSLVVLFPIVMLYGKMVDKLKKTNLFYTMACLYVVILALWTFFFANPTYGLANTAASPWRLSGWFWYAFVESFGSLVIALFWALVVDISTTKSSKHGFALIVMIGQIGGILGPKYLMKLPKLFNTSLALVVGVCGLLVLITAVLMWVFFKVTPQKELVGYQAQEKKHEEEPGFLEGLKIMLSHNYLLGIFGILAFFEFIVTVIDFNFKTMTFAYFPDCAQASEYFASYASSVNLVAFLCLFFGINNIQRFLGLRTALCLVPLIIGGAVLTFKLFPLIDVLFYLMVGAKAINYALNGPCIKQLYVPTSHEVKYKSQAWIETFGSRTAKASASFANLTKGFFGFELYLSLAVYFSLGLVAAWFFIAIFLANTYNKAIKEKTVVC
ncbi:MAG: NTP/NDP exchange transporter [Candidatus Babeliales bacterium]